MFRSINNYFPPLRNYIEINLTDNRKEDQFKLDFSRFRIREIISAEDSINGVNFNFGDSLEYGTMVKAINILNEEGAERYIPIDHAIYFFHVPYAQDTTVIIIRPCD